MHVISAVVEADIPSTKAASATIAAITDRRNVLVVLERDDVLGWKSLRNVVGVHLLVADQLNTYDVLCSDDVVFTTGALRGLPVRSHPGQGRQGRRHLDRGAGRGRDRDRSGGSQVRVADHRDVLIAPVISEKSYGLLDENKYTFLVDPDANKTEIKIAVEKVFGVKVLSVNTQNREGKRIRTRKGFGRRASTKRAIVSVAAGDRIDIFGGPVS